jgi:hypothetical protein
MWASLNVPRRGEPRCPLVPKLTSAFEGRRLLIAYYFMWHTGKPTRQENAQGPGRADSLCDPLGKGNAMLLNAFTVFNVLSLIPMVRSFGGASYAD